MLTLQMGANVGLNSANKSADVKLITALLNTYARNVYPLSTLSHKVDDDYIGMINDFQKNVLKMAKPDGVVTANGGTFRKLVDFLKNSYTTVSITQPSYGVLTWDAEGTEGGRYHSRCFHVPSERSGLTIGRGYDMREKTASKISTHLIQAGISCEVANVILLAAGKIGKDAELFIIENDLLDYEISAKAQLKLFEIIYKEMEADVKKICNKSITTKTYGKTDWATLHVKIKNVLIDLRFRGDYHPTSRKFLQKHVADNDLALFKDEIKKEKNWANVPAARRQARTKYINS
ncbi:hypothetical protein [Pseudocolwellia agarivorans]|uniref:hypothetical protein n=1 Tax=Pseudocolwellia agarivorans TaxID=1911682 RepID=UPI000985EA53|nr:hypothetical protein [Pseudocolwellia agarivorans]